MRQINRIFLHTAAAATTHKPGAKPVPVDQSAKILREYHVNVKGWKDIGYNDVVRMGGAVEPGRPRDMIPAGVEGANSDSYHVVLSGHGDIAAPSGAQWGAAVRLVATRLREFGLVERFKKNMMIVVGHREVNFLIASGVYPNAPKTYKTCPGTKVDMRKFRLAVKAELES